ncbi:G2/M phase-specific E3 ubiquitin-protein ligase-like [Acropora muricata]|uniref:G2/M phase-specific E3 ubiquitin-protein ligase-like n=1 Tax=Acropora muricata TaxID=159855 RepID=UPI0034E4EFB0
MVAHSIIQCGTGFPYLAPAIYWYLATEDLQVSIEYASRTDISHAHDEELSAITNQSDFLQLMSEAGETRILTPANKLDVLQSLMVFDILVKRKSFLDQFRKGLSTLGLLREMEMNPQLFEECFIHKGKVKQESVANCLRFDEDVDSERVLQLLQSFVRNASVQDLEDLLKFITGCHTSTSATLPHRVFVSCHDSHSFFASCCLLQFKLPKYFTSYAEFEVALRVAVEGKGSSFTTA